MNRIVHGNNLEVLRQMESGSAALIYIDPPFNTGRRQTRLRMKTVQDEAGDRVGFGGKRYRTELVASDANGIAGYADQFDDFLGFLRPRLEEAYRLLTPTGSLFFHIDYREVHYCKVMLDGIFDFKGAGSGRACFQNEIIWAYDYGARATKRWPAKHDTILWYTRDPERYTFNLGESDRIPYMAPGLVGRGEGRARQDPDRCVVAHHRFSDGQGEDGVCDAEAAGDSGADCAGSLEPRGPGAGFLCRQWDGGRGGPEEWPRLLHGG